MTCPFGQWLGANEATDPNRLGEVMADLADCWAHGTLGALGRRPERPLWVKSRPPAQPPIMSAFGGKADVNHCVGECPLLAISGHSWPI